MLTSFEPLLSRSLKKITLSFDLTSNHLEHYELFDVLSTAAPHIEHVRICQWSDYMWHSISDKVYAYAQSLPKLKSVALPHPALTPTTVAAYAAIGVTSLVDAYSTGCAEYGGVEARWWGRPLAYDAAEPHTKAVDSFLRLPAPPATTSNTERSRIRELTLCSDVHGIAFSLRHHVDLRNLTALDIVLATTDDIFPGLADVMRALGRTSGALSHLRLTAPNVLRHHLLCLDEPPPLVSPLPRMDWAVLAPLTACRGMAALCVVWDTYIRVSEDEFAALARAWPALRSLRLWGRRPDPRDYAEPCLSLAALRHLGAHCPVLEDVSLTLSPVGVPTGDLDDIQKLKCFRAETCELRFGLPAPDDDALVAAARRFLWHILPDAQTWFERNVPVLNQYDILTECEFAPPPGDAVATPGAYDSLEWRAWAEAVRSFGRKLGKLTAPEVMKRFRAEQGLPPLAELLRGIVEPAEV